MAFSIWPFEFWWADRVGKERDGVRTPIYGV